jgi:hypothetical protein
LRKQERTIINVVGSPVQREGTKIEVPGGWDMLMWQRLNVIEKKGQFVNGIVPGTSTRYSEIR